MRPHRFLVAALAVALVAAPAAAQAPATRPAVAAPATAATYLIDPVHSELSFRIRHLLGRVAGTFGEWGGTVVMDTVDVARSSVNVTIQTASIDTRVKQRDDHLRTPDFFAADSFPTITFRSTGVSMEGRHIRVAGDLTIRGRTRPVVLAGTYEGIFHDRQPPGFRRGVPGPVPRHRPDRRRGGHQHRHRGGPPVMELGIYTFAERTPDA